jgi:hypothetical protein
MSGQVVPVRPESALTGRDGPQNLFGRPPGVGGNHPRLAENRGAGNSQRTQAGQFGKAG